MEKRVVLYPFLFAIYIVLNPLVNNLDQLDPAQALRPLGALLFATLAGLLLFRALLRDWLYAGYLVFLLQVFTFAFGHLTRVLEEALPESIDLSAPGPLAVCGLLLLLLAHRGVWKRLGGGRTTRLLNVSLGLALFAQVLVALPELYQEVSQAYAQEETEILPQTGPGVELDCSESPDIYYLVLDGYGRADVLRELYGVDTDPFTGFLEEKGFYVAGESRANYTQTVYAIPAALNYEYVPPEPENANGRQYFTALIRENHVTQLLEACGYRTVAFESGFYFTNHPEVDRLLSPGSGLNELESLLLSGSPPDVLVDALELEVDATDHGYAAHRARTLFAFEELQRLAGDAGPKFVFAHILAPHPPFVFDAEGNPIQPGRGYSIGDGDDFKGAWEEYRRGYAGQVRFVNSLLEQAIETILAESGSPPVIILQGDHGPGGFLDWSAPDQTCLWERTSILNAYYLPDSGEAQLYPGISPVNSFRVVLNAYFGADLPLLPDRTYFTSHRLPRRQIDVTGEAGSRANCAGPAVR